MQQEVVFTPPRQPGLIVHLGLLVSAGGLGALGLIVALRSPAGLTLVTAMAALALAAAAAILISYRAYALNRATYTLAREGITIEWGLRVEEIPMPDVLWWRRPDELEHPPLLPLLPLPGGILGGRTDPVLGQLEYLASDTGRLVLLATNDRIYVISPADPKQFMDSLQEVVELGSLTALDARSIRPSSLLAEIASDPTARLLLAASLVLGVAVLLWVGLLIPSTRSLPVGFTPDGLPRAPSPAARMVVLGVVSATFLLADWIVGAYYFRQQDGRVLAYIFWLLAALTPALFLIVLYLSVSVGTAAAG